MLAIRAARAVARRPVLVGAVGVGGAVAYSAKRSGNSPAFYWCGGVETSFARLSLQFLPLRTAACASNIKPYDDDDDDDDDDEEPGFFARNYTVLLTSGGVIVSCVRPDVPLTPARRLMTVSAGTSATST